MIQVFIVSSSQRSSRKECCSRITIHRAIVVDRLPSSSHNLYHLDLPFHIDGDGLGILSTGTECAVIDRRCVGYGAWLNIGSIVPWSVPMVRPNPSCMSYVAGRLHGNLQGDPYNDQAKDDTLKKHSAGIPCNGCLTDDQRRKLR